MENSECTPFWELSEEDQPLLSDFLEEDYQRAPYDHFWHRNGDIKECNYKCKKCGQFRVSYEWGSGWCRRCRYTFTEYFGWLEDELYPQANLPGPEEYEPTDSFNEKE
jgi:hypothetical protein